jgi:hypothetical protein
VFSCVCVPSARLFFPQPSVTVRKVVFLDDRSSDKTLETLTEVVGSLDVLPFELDIVGSRTMFDSQAYVRSDPLGRPRPINLQQMQLLQEGKVAPLPLAPPSEGAAAASLAVVAGNNNTAAASQKRWWQVWKRSSQ